MTASDGQPAAGQEDGEQLSPGGVPPSFGVPAAPPSASVVPSAQEEPGDDQTVSWGGPPLLPARAEPVNDRTETQNDPAEPGDDQAAPGHGQAVTWYPAAPVAGPFAAPASTRHGTTRFRRSPKPAVSTRRAGRRLPAGLGGRGRLANVLLFGFGPLALAGVIVAAFVLVSPGRSAAARFQAGPAATAPQPAQATQSATGSPSPVHVKVKGKSKAKPKHPPGTPSPSPSAKKPGKTAAPKKPKPKPTHRSGNGRVVPHELGVPDFAGYCQHIGARTAEITASNAYGWHCTLYPSRVLQVISVCAWTYHRSGSQVVSVSTNFYDPNAWQCWRINEDLGALDFGKYCVAAGLGTSKLITGNAYGWRCTGSSAPIDTNAACDTVYHIGDAVSRFAVFADPYSWQCWD